MLKSNTKSAKQKTRSRGARRVSLLATLLAVTTLGGYVSPACAVGAPPSSAQPDWPRTLEADSERIEMYQPQIEQWNGNRIAGRVAVAVGAPNGTPTYGVARFSAQADIDKASGLVHLTHIKIDKVDVPTNQSMAGQVRNALSAHIPGNGMSIPLDELQTSYAASQELAHTMRVAVRNDVPNIVFSTTPTVLVLVDGAPAWRPVGNTGFERALNCRALLVRNAGGTLYVKAAGYWYRAQATQGPWQRVTQPEAALLAAAHASEAKTPADAMLPSDGKAVSPPPALMVATQPTELVVTDGAANLIPVTGTQLLTIANTDHAVFVYPATNTYYLLASGRWFSAPSTRGPWRWVPGSQLPADFARIPANDPKANVLVSVPNTAEAKEAAIAASIPQTASVSRSHATLDVSYDGSPRFASIEGTSLRYAVNTGTAVIEVDPAHYYAVANGVWFVGGTAVGPWSVATSVPEAIYAMPPASPLYYVTYVRVYSYTPDTVVVGYTPGYMGVVVSPDGTVVYGTGYDYPPYVGNVYYGYPPTYGYGAGFALGAAEGFAFGFAAGAIWGGASPYWGPYWGGYWGGGGWNNVNVNQANFYGRWGQGTVTHASGWNGLTGTQWRGAAGAGYNPATGTHFQGAAGGAFNPYSGNYAGAHQGSFSNPVTGREGAGRGGVAGNEYTGNYAGAHEGAFNNAATGREGVERGGVAGNQNTGNFAGGRQVAAYNPSTGRSGAADFGVAGNTQTGQVSGGSRGYMTNASRGNAVAWNNGDVYAGHDGNVYQRSANGDWQQHTSDGWQSVQPRGEVGNDLSQEHDARNFGQQRAMQNAGRMGGGWGGARQFGGGFHGGFRR